MRNTILSAGRDFAVYGIGSVLTQLVSVLLIPIYVRWLGIEDFGLLALLLGIQSVLVTLAQSGLGSALFRSYYDYPDEAGQQRVISTTLWVLCGTTTFIVIITFFFTDQFVEISGLVTVSQLHLITLIVFFEGLNTLPFSVFRARRQPNRYIITSLIVLIVRLLAVIYFVVVRADGLQGVLYGTLVGAAFSFIIGYSQLAGIIVFKIYWVEVKKLLRFGLPLIPANLAGWALAISGRYFLAHFGTVSDVGIYALADRFASVLSVLLIQPLFLLWLPFMLSVRQKEYAKHFYSRSLTYFVMVGIFISLALSLFAKEVLVLIATPNFMPARHYIFPLCLAILLYGANRLLNIGTDLARKSENGAIALLIAVVVFVGLNLLFTPGWGIRGVVFAACVAYGLMSGIVFVFSYRLYPIRYEWGQVASVFGIGLAIYGASLIVEDLLWESLWMGLLIKSSLLLAFLICLFLLGIVNNQERDELKRHVRRLVSTTQIFMWPTMPRS
jgi:O-antigen/teichoic acid export membrane protein